MLIEPLTRMSFELNEETATALWLYSAIIGNGRLLVCLDNAGQIAQLFYPHIDIGPHMRTFLAGLLIKKSTLFGKEEQEEPDVQGDKSPLVGEKLRSERYEPKVSWLTERGWSHFPSYSGVASVLNCMSINIELGLLLEQKMTVHHERDLLMNDIMVKNIGTLPIDCQFVLCTSLAIDNRRSGMTGFFDVKTSLLNFFSADRYVSFSCTAPLNNFSVEQLNVHEEPRSILEHLMPPEKETFLEQVTKGELSGREYAIGQVIAAISYNFGQIKPENPITYRLHMSCGKSLAEVEASACDVKEYMDTHTWYTNFMQRVKENEERTASGQPPLNLFSFNSNRFNPSIEDTAWWWRKRYADAQLNIGSPTVKHIYERSLGILRLLTDSETGGIIAAPECDPAFQSCGGYGYCWPRDGAFIAHALDSVGQHEHARQFYDWALRVQEASGVWYQRYYVNGQLGPSWGLVQFDETGAVVWAICRHIQMKGDLAYGRQAFPQLLRACQYMQKELDPETGLAPITKDLWEERDGISTYACASTWGAFSEFAQLATKLGESAEAEHWTLAANNLKTAIETHLWDAPAGRFLRGIKRKLTGEEVERLQSNWFISRKELFAQKGVLEEVYHGRTSYFWQKDATIDTAILGLSIPFGVFSPEDQRMKDTAEAIAVHLTSPVGGICRYEDDVYRREKVIFLVNLSDEEDNYQGGNPWIICTLWLALQDLAAGQKERAQQLYNWAVEHRTSLDLLPEQIDCKTGKPCWIIPLGWSHAMFLLATEEWKKHELL